MPAPTSTDELLELVIKSKLVEEPRLRTYIEKLSGTSDQPSDPAKLAQFLVRDGLLTYFQAEQLLQGKYKRFNLGKYKVLERLGSGGMGTVFLCEHKLMRRRVAVKVLPLPKAEDRASLDRFYREARAVAAVDHPNIVRAYDIDQDDNLHFLVMEWVDGTNLQELVKKFGPLDPIRACHYVYGAAVGLQHAHEIGLIHRDIKPGNILIDRSGVVKILDLGLARLTNDSEDNLTRQNDENVLGTADYLAPEQAMDSHTVDIRADIYSLGATFYFLLTGSAPFPEGSVAQKLIWHQNRQPRSISAIRPEVPHEVVAIVEKMMAKDAANRYKTPSDVIAALSSWVGTPIPPPSDREMPTLSPAVVGIGTSRGTVSSFSGAPTLVGGTLRTVPAAGSTTFTGMPTAIANAPPTLPATAPPAPLPPPIPQQSNGVPAVWETLDFDTQSVASDDTDKAPKKIEERPEEKERPSRVGRRGPPQSDRTLAMYALIGAAALVVVVVAVWFVFLKGRGKNPDPNPNPNPQGVQTRKITVSSSGSENTVKTLREALARVNEGDTIVIAESRLIEPALTLSRDKHKNLVIESATPDGRPAVIEYAGPRNGVMLDAKSVEGLHIKDVEFDGKGKSGIADTGVQISMVASGTTLENVIVRNVAKGGIVLWNVTGENQPITLDRVRIVNMASSDGGVISRATSPNGSLPNKFIVVKNSRFEGAGAGVRVEGPVLELDVYNNRFYNLNSAVQFTQPNSGASKGRIANNTIYQANTGLSFDVPPPPQPSAAGTFPPPPPAIPDISHYAIKVAQNYFARTNQLAHSTGFLLDLSFENNLHDANSKQSATMRIPATKINSPTLMNPNPEDDARFLRFQGEFPTAGPNKVRVGAE